MRWMTIAYPHCFGRMERTVGELPEVSFLAHQQASAMGEWTSAAMGFEEAEEQEEEGDIDSEADERHHPADVAKVIDSSTVLSLILFLLVC